MKIACYSSNDKFQLPDMPMPFQSKNFKKFNKLFLKHTIENFFEY